ncbi:MAG: DUF2505 domain-containing protein [Propionibacteriaceae bacterium]|nr:DUF2505 domain-containing protein [Propionibacteriaceae bacterium]
MHFCTHHHYDAAPAQVFAMLTDAQFLDGMFDGTDMAHRVDVEGSHTVLHVDLPAPRQATRFTGDTLHVTLDIVWAAQPGPDGRYTGPITMDVAKAPVQLSGTATIAPDGQGTSVTYEGEFTVRVPMFGRQLEQQAAPYVTRVLEIQQTHGRAWLAASH